MVQLDSKWYWIDLTWDDAGGTNPPIYTWFNKPDADFITGHTSHEPTTTQDDTDWLYTLPARDTVAYTAPMAGAVSFTTNLSATASVNEGSNITLSVVASYNFV